MKTANDRILDTGEKYGSETETFCLLQLQGENLYFE